MILDQFFQKLKRYGLNRYTLFFSIIILIVSIFVVGSYVMEDRWKKLDNISNSEPKGQNPNPEIKGDTGYKVERAVDGDTIEVKIGDKLEKVRYIGVNTPESVKPNTPVQCFGKEASEYNKNLTEGKTVVLEKDISDRDRYGRLLRYVYLVDDKGELEMINKKLVEEGYAQASTFPPDIKYQAIFSAAEKRARDEKKGLWGSCKN